MPLIDHRRLLPCLVILAAVCGTHAASADDWPQFRGPNATGLAGSAKGLPTKFSAEQPLWKVDVGEGISSPIVAGGKAFATGMVKPAGGGDAKFAIFALDATTGKELWRREFATGKLPRITPPNSHASSTPATDGERVYVHFSTLGLLAVNVADGTTAWETPMPMPAYLMDWGAGMSPIVHDGLVYFNQDDDLQPTLFALEAKTGKLAWKTERADMLAGYSIPVLSEVAGRTDLVVAGTGKLKGYDPKTGIERWTCNTLPRTMMTSPVAKDGMIYIAVQSYGDESRTLKAALMEWLDSNQDGKLARTEVPKEFHEKFDRSDKNKDAILDATEVETAFQSSENLVGGGSMVQAVKGGGTGNVTKTHVVFNLKNRAPSNLTSPLVVGEQIFVVKKGGLSSSYDSLTGKKHWELARIRNSGDYYGSPVSGDGKIYVPGENGFVMVLEQGPKLNVLAKNDLAEPCLSSPAIADGRLYFRTTGSLLCFSNEPQK